MSRADRAAGAPLRIALMGTRGVPARYGGFETAMEEIGRRLVEMGHEVTVYCRTGNRHEGDETSHLGMRLVHLPAVRKRSLETLSHTMLSAAHATTQRYDAVVLCNSANAPALPLLRARRVPVAVHVDGLEWRRAKWGPTGKRYYRQAESLSVRWADALIADAAGIADYYTEEFGVETAQIAYGAPDMSDVGSDRLAEVGLKPDQFHLVVARFEPENHVDRIVEGYLGSSARLPLVLVGSTPYPTDHTRHIQRLADSSPQVCSLGSLWDQELLDQLYAGARTYLHGHSVGGTNPSLLRGLAGGTPVIAFDSPFNREVAGEAGVYCGSAADFAAALDHAEGAPAPTREDRAETSERTRARYDWDAVARDYAALCADLAAQGPRRTRRSGRRLT